jgi:hypothetical protein
MSESKMVDQVLPRSKCKSYKIKFKNKPKKLKQNREEKTECYYKEEAINGAKCFLETKSNAY